MTKPPPKKSPPLTDHEVALVRRLHEREGMSYGMIAAKMNTPKVTIRAICRYKRR